MLVLMGAESPSADSMVPLMYKAKSLSYTVTATWCQKLDDRSRLLNVRVEKPESAVLGK